MNHDTAARVLAKHFMSLREEEASLEEHIKKEVAKRVAADQKLAFRNGSQGYPPDATTAVSNGRSDATNVTSYSHTSTKQSFDAAFEKATGYDNEDADRQLEIWRSRLRCATDLLNALMVAHDLGDPSFSKRVEDYIARFKAENGQFVVPIYKPREPEARVPANKDVPQGVQSQTNRLRRGRSRSFLNKESNHGKLEKSTPQAARRRPGRPLKPPINKGDQDRAEVIKERIESLRESWTGRNINNDELAEELEEPTTRHRARQPPTIRVLKPSPPRFVRPPPDRLRPRPGSVSKDRTKQTRRISEDHAMEDGEDLERASRDLDMLDEQSRRGSRSTAFRRLTSAGRIVPSETVSVPDTEESSDGEEAEEESSEEEEAEEERGVVEEEDEEDEDEAMVRRTSSRRKKVPVWRR